MSTTAEHTHHIRVRSTQLEIPPAARSSRVDDYDDKLKAAQDELNRIQQQREELEQKKRELEELTARKRNFLTQQVEVTEKLAGALTLIDRELYVLRQETTDLEQCRVCFASHLDKLQKINPEIWTRENMADRLEKSTASIDIAMDEFEQAAAHFEKGRSGQVFGGQAKRAVTKPAVESQFSVNFRNGLAFNLPILLLGGAALAVYLLK